MRKMDSSVIGPRCASRGERSRLASRSRGRPLAHHSRRLSLSRRVVVVHRGRCAICRALPARATSGAASAARTGASSRLPPRRRWSPIAWSSRTRWPFAPSSMAPEREREATHLVARAQVVRCRPSTCEDVGLRRRSRYCALSPTAARWRQPPPAHRARPATRELDEALLARPGSGRSSQAFLLARS